MKSMDVALICKALGDSNRLEIVRMLSDGEKCGCKLLEKFEITQPTLSHHMKILVGCGLVNDRKEGKWHHYSLNCETLNGFKAFIDSLSCVPVEYITDMEIVMGYGVMSMPAIVVNEKVVSMGKVLK